MVQTDLGEKSSKRDELGLVWLRTVLAGLVMGGVCTEPPTVGIGVTLGSEVVVHGIPGKLMLSAT